MIKLILILLIAGAIFIGMNWEQISGEVDSGVNSASELTEKALDMKEDAEDTLDDVRDKMEDTQDTIGDMVDKVKK